MWLLSSWPANKEMFTLKVCHLVETCASLSLIHQWLLLRPAAWELHVCSALRFWLFNKGVCFCVLSIYIFTLILPGNPSVARFTFKRKHRRKLNKFNYLKICSTCSVFRICIQINWYNKRQKEAFRMCLSAICL